MKKINFIDPLKDFDIAYISLENEKCFVAHSYDSPSEEAILTACAEVLPKFKLEPWYAYLHSEQYQQTNSIQYDTEKSPLEKIVAMIANARYGIYDLTMWEDKNGIHQARNVFLELGIAIGLNRPALLLYNKSKQSLPLPDCLEGLEILKFSGELTLKEEFEKNLPIWIENPPKRDWWNRYCHFGQRVCEYREIHPRKQHWGQRKIQSHVFQGEDIDHKDFRTVIDSVLDMYSDIEKVFIGKSTLSTGYNFKLCTTCQQSRSGLIKIFRLTENLSPEAFISIGISIAEETQFGYKIPKVFISDSISSVPSLLTKYEIQLVQNDTALKSRLRISVPAAINQVQKTTWRPQALPFVEMLQGESPVVLEESENLELNPGQDIQLIASLDISEIDILLLINNTINEERWPLKAKVTTNLGNQSLSVKANSEWLQRALQIILNNSKNATFHKRKPEIDISIRSHGNIVDILVSDNGIGIPANIRDKVFKEPIKLAQNGGSGTNLLLAKKIVETYKGNLYLQGTSKARTTFVISLPIIQNEAEKIVIVDDEEEFPAIARLIELGRQKSYVNLDDILKFFPEAEQSVEQLEEAFSALLSAGIPFQEDAADYQDRLAVIREHLNSPLKATMIEGYDLLFELWLKYSFDNKFVEEIKIIATEHMNLTRELINRVNKLPNPKKEKASLLKSIKSLLTAPVKIFVSYDHRDRRFRDEFVTMLVGLQRQGVIDLWQDHEIEPGPEWFAAIKKAMGECELAVLLISQDFMASRFIQDVEFTHFLKRRIEDGLRILPIIIRDCLWKTEPMLKNFQALPKGGKPVISFSIENGDRNQVWTDIGKSIESIAKGL